MRAVVQRVGEARVTVAGERVAEMGGLHAFARWPHAITTDSGGFQAFSLAERNKMTEEGFEFS